MKKLFTLFLLTLTISIFAQRNSGFKIGSTLSWCSTTISGNPEFEQYYELSPSFSFHLGYSWNIKLTEKYSLQTDLLYNTKGSTLSIKDPNDPIWPEGANNYLEYNQYFKNVYLSAPISLNYVILPKLVAELGGEAAFALDGDSGDIWDFFVIAGATYSTKYADISLRYIHGITSNSDIYYSPKNVYTPDTDSQITIPYTNKYRTFQFSLTIPVFKYLKKAMHRE